MLRPDDADAWRVLAEGLAAAGKRDRQAAALEHVIALDPDDLSAYLDLAGLDVAVGKADASKDVYLRYEARRRDALVQLGKSKDAGGRAAGGRRARRCARRRRRRARWCSRSPTRTRRARRLREALGRIGVDIDPDVRPALQALLKKENDARCAPPSRRAGDARQVARADVTALFSASA